MKALKTKLSVLVVCSSLILPNAVSAATATTTATDKAKEIPTYTNSIAQTKVNGISVPGIYIVTKDSRVALIPDGIGIVVVHKDIKLPAGSRYITATE
ncbi:hypothetical protein ACFQI7_02370 [Paenibacillus allorhizosphaerae]|uniref:Uncharacterized protein n=1 Tax=Paenibacillus allorhizosphaerae TaxID=2849866 RepID=A0ABM8VAX5_9BACL|nr:hypothetical protein [Paenibacillus allorhizosphaerae]CAG7617677.1 hypothetical protein PAECIP111802_00436 [Paenibacillus allorhizosphaerae]